MGKSFSKFKNKFWFTFESASRRLATTPKPVQNACYGMVYGLLIFLYYVPNIPLRRTSVAFASVIKSGPPRKLHAAFARSFVLGLRRMETLRFGPLNEIDGLLKIPDQGRLECLLKKSGVLLIMPHCHASVVMVRALAARYPTLMLIRSNGKKARADSQWTYYENLGCEVVDVRYNNDGTVARAVLKALRHGKIVVGVVDRIEKSPNIKEPINKTKDTVRVLAFGQPVGLAGWPARFSAKCRVPILPAMAVHSPKALTLHFSDPIYADDLVSATQIWTSAIEQLIRRFPSEWLFVYDKGWANILRKNTITRRTAPTPTSHHT